jgi:hypothetical protein
MEPKGDEKPVSQTREGQYMGYYHRSNDEKKRAKGLSNDAKAVIAVVLSVVIIFVIMGLAFFTLSRPSATEQIPLFSSEVIISDGGHFFYDLSRSMYGDSTVTISISSSGGEKFDVYIMDDSEYQNAYGNTNVSLISFSAYYAYDDVSEVSATLELPVERWFYLVIDNRDTPLTPNDATPSGVITVDVSISMESFGYID